ncbi:MAG TPA: signal transduction protein, partial [Rheinheimera sp.]
ESDSDAEKQLFALLKLAEHFSGESRQLFELSLDPEWEQHKSAILEVLDIEPLQLPELAELLHRQQISTIYSV